MQREAVDRPACFCCGGQRWRRWAEGLVQCTACGYVGVSTSYTEDELRAVYNSAYFHGDEYRDYRADRPVIECTLARRLVSVRRRVPRGRRLLEIGCAYGYFLALAEADYPDSVGVDIAESATRYARETLGVDARTGDPAALDLSDERFDAVCFWDVIEHVPNPADTVEVLAERVKSGGWLFLTTGDVGALVPRIQGARWRLVHPPSHLHYFTRTAVKAMLAARGFRVQRITTAAVDRSAEQIVHGLTRFGGFGLVRGIASWLHRSLPSWCLRVRIPLDLGDIMLVEAQRT